VNKGQTKTKRLGDKPTRGGSGVAINKAMSSRAALVDQRNTVKQVRGPYRTYNPVRDSLQCVIGDAKLQTSQFLKTGHLNHPFR